MPGSRITINAKEAAKCFKSGQTPAEIKRKFGLNDAGYSRLLQKLTAAGLLAGMDIPSPAEIHGKIAEMRPCPACGSPQFPKSHECSDCGIIFSKYLERQKCLETVQGGQEAFDEGFQTDFVSRPKPSVASPSAAHMSTVQAWPENDFEDDDEEEELRPEVREFDSIQWKMLAVGVGLSLLCVMFSLPNFFLSVFKTLVHELGHAVFGWLYGYPSFPAFDFMYGGGMTFNFQQNKLIVLLIMLCLAGLLFLLRKNATALIVFGMISVLHLFVTFTNIHSLVIIFMGHGMELLIAGLFIYRALSGRSIVHGIERPLYAILGFFLVFSDVGFAYRLLTSHDEREEYFSAKGGDVDMDFLRIARDHFHTDSIGGPVFFFLVLSIVVPVLALLAYRYEQYIHSFLAKLLTRDPETKSA